MLKISRRDAFISENGISTYYLFVATEDLLSVRFGAGTVSQNNFPSHTLLKFYLELYLLECICELEYGFKSPISMIIFQSTPLLSWFRNDTSINSILVMVTAKIEYFNHHISPIHYSLARPGAVKPKKSLKVIKL